MPEFMVPKDLILDEKQLARIKSVEFSPAALAILKGSNQKWASRLLVVGTNAPSDAVVDYARRLFGSPQPK